MEIAKLNLEVYLPFERMAWIVTAHQYSCSVLNTMLFTNCDERIKLLAPKPRQHTTACPKLYTRQPRSMETDPIDYVQAHWSACQDIIVFGI